MLMAGALRRAMMGGGSDVAPVDDVASDDASDGDAKSEIPDGSSPG